MKTRGLPLGIQKNILQCILILIITVFISCKPTLENVDLSENGSGILLAFDDYFPDSWREHFDLFDKYNARVTFFVLSEYPDSFCFEAKQRGHEIAYHTINHLRLPEINDELFVKETTSAIKAFNEKGLELHAFAYPYGDWESWMHERLLEHYEVVRGFDRFFHIYKKESLGRGYISSMSIDNLCYKTDESFRNRIIYAVYNAKKNANMIITLTTHQISNADWGITKERLEFLLKTCNDVNLKFFRYQDISSF